jgi:hypothetical protein
MARTTTDNATTAATRQIWQRARQTAQDAKPVVAQVKPLANDTKAAASRGLYKARAWAAPQVDRTGQVLQDTVAPKVAAALHTSAQRLDPDKPKRNGWLIAAGVSALLAVAAAAAAALRNRMKPTATAEADEEEAVPVAESANTDGAKADASRTS